ncbi:MAG: 50S ribosomal protein L5 [Phycisphaerae bacterium]|nr:50S ribosomal protein L5 [Phycisphaerae bacterium]|tara:strand:- start:7271 stop:7855 length:585 start_codon:yes stop_codon:yes gene_type:complete
MIVAQTITPRLKTRYMDEIEKKALAEFGLKNRHQLPLMEKVILNCGVGRFLENQKLKPEIRDTITDTLTTITGQRPIMVLARKSVSNFKVREGAPSAFMVTLRGDRMWHFLDRLINLAIPRIKDFRGIRDDAFDQAGNYGMGLTEQAVWPEINMARVNFTHGMNINICLRQSDPAKSLFVLKELGMPFVRKDED